MGFRSVITKRLPVLIIVLLLTLSVYSGDLLAYNRDAAVEYAGYFYDKVASDGIYWVGKWVDGEKVDSKAWSFQPGTSIGLAEGFLDLKNPGDWYSTDCAHFTSSAIGSPPSHNGYSGGGLEVPDRADGYGEPGANKLIEWAIQKVGREVDSVDKLVKGDIIGYDLNHDGHLDHTSVYLGKERAAAHSESWKGHWHLGYDPSDFEPTFVHITREAKPEVPWRLLAGIGAAFVTLLGWHFLL
ncbi:MAG: hypothetical protein ACOC86_00285 [Candidatus Bipolaricaulota bacterium]